MKFLFCTVGILLFIITKFYKLKNIKYKEPKILSNKKILTIYYSTGNNTKNVANCLNSVIGGDIKEIKPIENYPNNILKMSQTVRRQIKLGYLPEINDIDISEYDIIFVGSPIWNFSVSLPAKSFIKKSNFENKILIPFFTYSGGASKNKIIKEIKNLTNTKDISKPLFMFENGFFLTKERIITWLNKL